MRRSIRGALGAALLVVVAVPVVAGATELTDQTTADVVSPAAEVAPTTPPSSEPAPTEAPSQDAPVTIDAPAVPDAPAPEAIVAEEQCDPNYFGACVPMGAGDVDCSDLTGGVISIGTDPYGLDGDGDGIACEPGENTPVTPETTVPPTTTPPTTTPPTTAPTTTAPTAPTSTSTTAPAAVVAGTETSCHPSYQGACVPVGTGDVNCSEIGAVNLQVVGPDQYRLDADADGIACEATALEQVAQVRGATITRTSTGQLATTGQLASTGSSSGIGAAGMSMVLAGLALLGGGMLLTTVGPWRTRGGFTVVRYDRYGRERRDRVVNDTF